MVVYGRPGLAPIPEMDVYPLPGEEAKTESIRSRFQAMMEQENPGSPVSALDREWEYDFEECKQLASDLKAMSESKARQALLWIGDKIKMKSKIGALDASRDWAAWKSVYQRTGAAHQRGIPLSELSLPKKRSNTSSFGPLLKKHDRKGWKATKAKISVKGRQIKYALAIRPATLVKACARTVKHRTPGFYCDTVLLRA